MKNSFFFVQNSEHYIVLYHKYIIGETLVYGFWPLLYFWPLLDLWALLYFWAFLLVWPRYILNSFGVWCFLYSFVLWPLLFYELFQKKYVRFLTFFIWSFFVPFYFCFHIHSVSIRVSHSHQIKVIETIFGECLNYKSGLRILIWPLEVPFFWSQRLALLAKVTVFGPKKMALRVAKSKF